MSASFPGEKKKWEQEDCEGFYFKQYRGLDRVKFFWRGEKLKK